MPLCHARDVAFVIADRMDLAVELGAEGVHLEASRPPLRTARRRLGREAILGVSCGTSRHRAMVAGEAGADYVAFGPFFPSPAAGEIVPVDPEILTWWTTVAAVPCVAWGGVTLENCAPLIEAGADFLAVSAAVWDHREGSKAAIRAFNDVIVRVGAS